MTQDIFSKPINLNEDEELIIEPKKRTNPADAKQQYNEWKKYIKYNILQEIETLNSKEEAQRRVTLGEMSDAMEESFGRYKANIRTISGVYAMNAGKNEYFEKALNLTQKFEEEEGRRPRLMVAKMGQDGHDRGAKVVATAFADMGFDVDVAPLFQTPEEVAKQAVENDIHILGVSSLAAGHKTLVPQVVEELKKLGADDITIVVGGVIPQQDYEFLYANGADFIFGPGTNLPKCAVDILEKFLGF